MLEKLWNIMAMKVLCMHDVQILVPAVDVSGVNHI
jgi:hypothetical protein